MQAYESLSDAVRALERSPFRPSLLIAELSGDEPAPDFKQLSALALRLPAWILASHSELDEASLKDRGFEAVLFRPIDMSDLVRRVKQRLKELSDGVIG